MSVFQIALTGFEFPSELDDSKANFRFVVDLRFINEKDQFIAEHAVMPSLDTFWECDTGKSDKPNYVRKVENGQDRNEFDMDKIDAWDRLVLIVKANQVHSIQFKVFDVNREDAWDKIKNFLKGVVEVLFGKVRGLVSSSLPAFLGDSLGGATDDVQSFLLKKLAGGDKVLFRGSKALSEGDNDISGEGTKGWYRIDFRLSLLPLSTNAEHDDGGESRTG